MEAEEVVELGGLLRLGAEMPVLFVEIEEMLDEKALVQLSETTKQLRKAVDSLQSWPARCGECVLCRRGWCQMDTRKKEKKQAWSSFYFQSRAQHRAILYENLLSILSTPRQAILDFVFRDEIFADTGTALQHFRMHQTNDIYKLLRAYAESRRRRLCDLVVILPTLRGWLRLSGLDFEHKDIAPISPSDLHLHTYTSEIQLLCPRDDQTLDSPFCTQWFREHRLHPLCPDLPPHPKSTPISSIRPDNDIDDDDHNSGLRNYQSLADLSSSPRHHQSHLPQVHTSNEPEDDDPSDCWCPSNSTNSSDTLDFFNDHDIFDEHFVDEHNITFIN